MGWKISIDKIRDLNYNITIMDDKKLKDYLDNCCYNRPFDTVRNKELGKINDGWFTLDGRKLDGKPSAKGVYINNGRKTVIK